MRKSLKSKISGLLAVLIIVSSITVAYAAETTFTKRLVDSNSYSYITAATKETTSTTAAVNITDIYKADGSASSYTTVYVKATTTGTGSSVVKGSSYDIAIPSGYQAKGSYVSMYSQGNTPWLDCQISGYWNVH